MPGVDIVDHSSGPDTRLSPSHMAPDRRDGIEVAAAKTDEPPRRGEGRAHRDRCPRVPPISRAIDQVGAIVSAAPALVHARHENATVGGAAGQLNVTDETGAEEDWSRPRDAV